MSIFRVRHKHLLIVAFFLLCFISIEARATRPLQERNNAKAHEKGQEESFRPKENGVTFLDGDDLAMDYTPARRKPPIHN
ncbi:Root meristem growth factor 9 [Quillaja saponaria]|uniref:Root meristem growth factor 9 n=1 Tax=Quillaja saponaria TaxID=32244 RepID=A0AAD7KSP5_QUISA|nr:Root meristem growth factor 9 [Quillaja saponaria]